MLYDTTIPEVLVGLEAYYLWFLLRSGDIPLWVKQFVLKLCGIAEFGKKADYLYLGLFGCGIRVNALPEVTSSTCVLMKWQYKLQLSMKNKVIIIKLNDLLYAEAQRSYAMLYLKGGRQILVSKPLKHFEGSLDQSMFYRCGRRYLINLSEVTELSKGIGCNIQMSEGKELVVNSEQGRQILQRIEVLNQGI